MKHTRLEHSRVSVVYWQKLGLKESRYRVKNNASWDGCSWPPEVMLNQDQQLFSDDPPRWTHNVSTRVMSTILNEEQRFSLLHSIALVSHLDFQTVDAWIHTSLSKFKSNCSARNLKPLWKNRRTLFLFLLIPDCACFHVRREIVLSCVSTTGKIRFILSK